MTGNDRPPSANSQRERILQLLSGARGAWVPLPEIAAQAAQYNARIFELRRAGYEIENRTKDIDGARHSWFRIPIPKPVMPMSIGTVPETLPLPFEKETHR